MTQRPWEQIAKEGIENFAIIRGHMKKMFDTDSDHKDDARAIMLMMLNIKSEFDSTRPKAPDYTISQPNRFIVGETVAYYRARTFSTRPQAEYVVIRKVQKTKVFVEAVSDQWPFWITDIRRLRKLDEIDIVGIGDTVTYDILEDKFAKVVAVVGNRAWLQDESGANFIKFLDELKRMWLHGGFGPDAPGTEPAIKPEGLDLSWPDWAVPLSRPDETA